MRPPEGGADAVRELMLHFEPTVFAQNFNRRPFVLRHDLSDHPLFALPRLIELARRLPAHSVEYNAGDVPLSLDPGRTPQTGLSVEETIRHSSPLQLAARTTSRDSAKIA